MRKGFTLLEMVLALAIGLVLMISLYNVLNMQVYQAQSGRLIQQEGTLARSILTRMTRDILANIGPVPTAPVAASSASSTSTDPSAATTTPDTSNTITFNNGVYGTSNVLVLTASKVPSNPDPTQQSTNCDLRRISYWMVSDGVSGLAYQELSQPTSNDLGSIPPDVAPGSYQILASEVKDIKFEYFDGVNWQDYWDGTTLGGPTGEIPIGPPSAIKITLTFSRKGADNADLPAEQFPYQHVVAIPAGNNFPQTNP